MRRQLPRDWITRDSLLRGESKQPFRVPRGRFRDDVRALSHVDGQRPYHLGEGSGLVAPVPGNGPDAPRQQVGRVGFHDDTIERNRANSRAQVSCPTIVTNPACNPDVQTKVQVVNHFCGSVGEAVGDTLGQRLALLSKNRQKVMMGVALMQEDGAAGRCGKLKLP